MFFDPSITRWVKQRNPSYLLHRGENIGLSLQHGWVDSMHQVKIKLDR